MKNPFLVGSTIYLRSIDESDLTPHYREWFNDAEVCQFNSHHRFPNYDENMRDYFESTIKSRDNLILAICDKSNDLHLGNVSLQDIDALNQSAEFAILIGDKTYWGKGVGKEATQLIVEHGFKQLNLHRIYCGTAEDNMGMQNLALAMGFKEEGRFNDAIYKDGKFKNSIHYSLIRKDNQA